MTAFEATRGGPHTTVDDAYPLYLRGELAKLRHDGDARDFLARGRCGLVRLALPGTLDGLTAFFASQARVDDFVSGLDRLKLEELTACCVRWRENGVAPHLARARQVEYVRVPTAAILVREAEQGLVPAFRRNSFWLTAVAIDPEVLSSEPYRSCTDHEEVDLRICIARREPGRPGEYRLIDGVHRAIQLYRNGEREIDLCVLGEQS